MSVAAYRFDNAKRRRPEAHPNQRQLTPPYVLEPIRALFGGTIELDPCTEPDNPTAALRFYAPPQDGATLPWDVETVFVNPPYGELRERWVHRCVEEGRQRRVVLLMPAHTDARVTQYALRNCVSVVFLAGRVKFGVKRLNGSQEAASHGSALFGFGIDVAPLGQLGVALKRVGG